MGASVGINVTKKSQRGIVAKRFMEKVEMVELNDFEKQMPNLLADRPKGIPVKVMGEVAYYV